ncbi:MAG: hypothetical protein ABIG44_19130 [Planctomycetota bacterium]
MTSTRDQAERRTEPRHQVPARRISWATDDARQIHAGWIRDVATSSIGFVTPTRDRPASGQVLELTFEPGGPAPQYQRTRVMRTAPCDRYFSVVGCRHELSE